MHPSFLYKFVKAVGGTIMKLMYRTKIVGKENIPKDGGFIICCNHTHFLDVAFLVTYFPQYIRFMAKEELFKSKKSYWFVNGMGGFPVERGSGTGAITAIRTCKRIVKAGAVLGIFPEGTRSKDGRPHSAKSGIALIAASTGANVLPVSIYYEGKLNLFKRVTIRIGNLIPQHDLILQSKERTELKRVTGVIMDKITSQWEEGHCK